MTLTTAPIPKVVTMPQSIPADPVTGIVTQKEAGHKQMDITHQKDIRVQSFIVWGGAMLDNRSWSTSRKNLNQVGYMDILREYLVSFTSLTKQLCVSTGQCNSPYWTTYQGFSGWKRPRCDWVAKQITWSELNETCMEHNKSMAERQGHSCYRYITVTPDCVRWVDCCDTKAHRQSHRE